MPSKSNNVADLRAVIKFLLPSKLAKHTARLTKQPTIFGRDGGDVRLNDPLVSAVHCQIQFVEGEYVLFDMNSSNGTYVNEIRQARHTLSAGDTITIGNTSFQLLLLPASEVKTLPLVEELSQKFDRAENEKTTIVKGILEERQKVQKNWNIKIIINYPDQSCETHILKSSAVRIGRGSSIGRLSKVSSISRTHLLVKTNESGEIVIEDQGSTNGTFVNGERILGLVILRHNDLVEIGEIQLRITAVSNSS